MSEEEKSVKLKSVAGVEIVRSPKGSSKDEGPEKMSRKPPGGDTGDSCIISGSDISIVEMGAAAVTVTAAVAVGIVAGTF
jgi:hypothetical protein